MVMPLDRATWIGENGVQYLRPEIVLLFEARHAREKDQQDFDTTLPELDSAARLAAGIAGGRPSGARPAGRSAPLS